MTTIEDFGRAIDAIKIVLAENEPATVVPGMSAIMLDADVTNGVAVPGATTFPPSDHNLCVDLRTVDGSRFKVRKEADAVTWMETPERERIWLLELPCRHGVVYPQGGDILAATITSRRIGNQVAALPGIRSSRGDTERVVTFHVNDVEPVLALLKPHRRRQVSPEERERLVAMGQHHRFHGAQVPKTDPGSTLESQDDLECQPGREVLAMGPEVTPSEGTGHPANECYAPDADHLVPAQRRISAPYGRKARG